LTKPKRWQSFDLKFYISVYKIWQNTQLRQILQVLVAKGSSPNQMLIAKNTQVLELQ